MSLVKAVFHSEEQAGGALNALRELFVDEALSMALYRVPRNKPGDLDRHDPADSVRLAGTPINTMAATGVNIVGNSSTADVRLGDLPTILRYVAQDEEAGDDRLGHTAVRIEAVVTCADDREKLAAKEIIGRFGGKEVRTIHNG